VGGVEVTPFNSCNFVLPHRRCDRKSDDAPNRDLLPNVCFKGRDNTIEFILSGSAITLIAFSDKPEASESYPRKINRFS
jgi:hypothetical protein